MMDVGRHPRIKMMTNSEVEKVSGFIGNFKVRVRRKARFVDESQCTGCGDCAKACPVSVPDEYQGGFSSRKAIYIPFPQAVPSAYIIDVINCLGYYPIECGKCQDACDKKCINYDDRDKFEEYNVGAVIVATGMDVFDPSCLEEYGYTKFENVITSMEFERLICAGGPTEGHFVRPTDKSRPKRIGFVQCVGSRSKKRGNPYCSNICCMNTVKDTLLLADHYPDTESTVFYMDIRAFGKGFEDLYTRSKDAGVHYIRGLPGKITGDPKTGNLTVVVENTISGEIERHELDMVVLSIGVIPAQDSDVVQQLLTLSKTSDGFFLEAHPKLKPVDAPTKGVYFAGCAESPKDVKDSVTQAGAAAARVSSLLNQGIVKVEAITSYILKELCTKCGICATVCPYNSIEAPNKNLGLYPTIIEAACAGCGNCASACPFDAIIMKHFRDEQYIAQIDATLAEKHMEKIVVFACNWCSYAGGDGAGTARLQYPTSNRLIRTMCSARVDEQFVIHAFRKGAPIVLVSGCHFSDCHYITAVRSTQLRVERLWNKLEKLGIRPERLQLEWISAAEGQKFAKVMREIEELRKKVTEKEVSDTMRILEEEERKTLERKAKALEKKSETASVI
jgi:heterodisulfide reductase subunit A